MRRVVVTGASGFVARHLIPNLVRANWRVTGVARAAVCPVWLDGIEWLSADVTCWHSVHDLIARTAPQALVHLAGQTHGGYVELIASNSISAINLLHAARELVPGLRLVLFGSAAEYGALPECALPIDEDAPCEPLGGYGATKLVATIAALSAARNWNAKVSVIRPFNIVGSHMPATFVAGALLNRIYNAMHNRDSGPVTVGRTDTTRDFVDVIDLVEAVTKLLEIDASGEIFNICSGRETSIRKLLDMIIEIAGGSVPWVVDPSLVRPGDVARSFGSCARAQSRLGFQPRVTLERSLQAAWRARLAWGGS